MAPISTLPLRHPRACAGLALALTLLALPALPKLRIDNSLEVWVDRDGPEYAAYRNYLETFGSEEFVLLAYPAPASFDRQFLERLTELRLDLEEVAGIGRIHCLSRVYTRWFPQRGLAAFNRELVESPFWRNFLISEDRRWAALWLEIDPAPQVHRLALVEAIETTLSHHSLGPEIHLAGSPILNAALDRDSRRSSRRFLAPVLLCSFLFLWFLLRHAAAVLVPGLAVGAGLTWTLAILSLGGGTLNMVSIALPPLVWVLGLSTSIHLLSRLRSAPGLSRQRAIRATYRQVLWPALASALVTACSFACLLSSGMQPVRQMGAISAVGVLACLLANLLLFPYLAQHLLPDKFFSQPRDTAPASVHGQRGRPRSTALLNSTLARLAKLSLSYRKGILWAALAAATLLGISMLSLRAESNVIRFFRPEAPIVRAYEQVLPNLTGPYSLELLIQLRPGLLDLATLSTLDRLETSLLALPGVATIIGPVDLVKKAWQEERGAATSEFELPTSDHELDRSWASVESYLGSEMEAFFRPASGLLRLSILARPMGSAAHGELVEAIRTQLSVEVPATWHVELTGIVPLLVEMQDRLLDSQIRSFAASFATVACLLLLLLRSPRYVLLSLPPNLFPMLFALGLMGLLGIGLDPATVMIASIALGIAVNDTLHFFSSYRRARGRGATPEAAVHTTLREAGGPAMLTTLVAASGFLVLLRSDFLPLANFGLLTSVTLGAALLADLVLLPALWLSLDHSAPVGRGSLEP